MRLSELKRRFYSSKISANPNERVESIQRRYFTSLFPTEKTESIDTLEKMFLRYIIVENELTPSTNYESELLIQAVLALGFLPLERVEDNWRTIYQNY